MPTTESTIIRIAILVIVFLFLGVFIIVVLLRYRAQQRKSLQDKELMKAEFNQQLSLSRLEIQQETFNFISQEIHDNVGQILSIVKMQLNVMQEKNSFPAEEVAAVRSNAGRAINELRAVAQNINSEWLENLSLTEAIQKELDYINKAGRTRMSFCMSGVPKEPAGKAKIILFRIVQEACQNIIKHAEATTASISIHYATEDITITIADNGCGFAPTPSDQEGMGLKNIHKRVLLLGGTLDIQSSPGSGTTLHLKIPYTT